MKILIFILIFFLSIIIRSCLVIPKTENSIVNNCELVTNKWTLEIYNIGSSKPIKIKKVVGMIKSLVKKGYPIYGSFKLRKNENIKLFPDTTKLRKEIGWKPRFSLAQGLILTIDYIKKNK